MSPSTQQIPVPTLPTSPGNPPVIAAQTPVGQKPKRQSATPSYLNSSATPSKANIGQKQLVGQ